MPFILGIAGGTGSGKSTLARAIAGYLAEGLAEVDTISQDSYYKTTPREIVLHPDHLKLYNYDHPDSLETSLLVQHLETIKNGGSVVIPSYDFVSSARLPGGRNLDPSVDVIIVEGILLFHDPKLRSMFDYRVFVDAPADIRLARRLLRDTSERGQSVQGVLEQYFSTVRDAHNTFVEGLSGYADLIVDGSKPLEISLNHVLQHLRWA